MAENYRRKIVGLDGLLAAAEEARARKKVIVQCHGCFDIVHPGHVRYLQFAREQGDVLIVTLTADAAIGKGAASPYIPQELRAENLAALELVDHVYIDPSPTAESVLDAVRPDVYVKGREYETSRDPGFLRERAIVESYGGRVIFSSGAVVFSSTQLIANMPRVLEVEQHRLELLRRRHGVDRSTLLDAVDRFAGRRVLVIGDTVLDRYVFCDAIDVASESPILSLARLREERFIGGAAIVARHLAALGAAPVLLSATATDGSAQSIADALRTEGVTPYLIPCRPASIEKTRYLVEQTKMLKVESAAQVPLDSRAERHAVAVVREHLDTLDAAIFCDFGYGTITAGLLGRILPDFVKRGIVLTGDVSGSRGNLLQFSNFDVFCPTEREIRSTLHDFDSGLSSIAWQLMDRTRAKCLIVTLGSRGLVTFERRSDAEDSPEWSGRLLSEHLPSFAEQCVDNLGCGDALLAAATLARTAGLGLIPSAWLGNLAAAAEASHMGNIPISRDELRARVWRNTEPAADRPEPCEPAATRVG